MLLNFGKKLVIAATVFSLSFTSQADQININFDTISTGADVDQYYIGGTDSYGEIGPDLGVDFYGFTTLSGFGETSEPNMVYSNSVLSIINVSPGFSSVSFTYGNFATSSFSVWSGLDGTGALLGSVDLLGDPYAFTLASIPFSGVAESITINSPYPTAAAIDDLSITIIPIPGALWLFGSSMIGLMSLSRRVLVG